MGNANGTFTLQADPLTTGNTPVGIAVGDFSNSGNLDLAVTNSASDTVNIFVGDGKGGFQKKTPDLTVGIGPRGIAVGDFNGDGYLDLQLGAYVSYLDLGIQTGVSKFVAEYDAKGDHAGARRHASAGFALMSVAGIIGVGLSIVLAWQVPRLFSTMPASLYHEVRQRVANFICIP